MYRIDCNLPGSSVPVCTIFNIARRKKKHATLAPLRRMYSDFPKLSYSISPIMLVKTVYIYMHTCAHTQIYMSFLQVNIMSV